MPSFWETLSSLYGDPGAEVAQADAMKEMLRGGGKAQPGWNYGEILPFSSDPEGTIRPAVPRAVYDPISAMSRIMGGSVPPVVGDDAQGERLNPEIVDAGQKAAALAATGALPGPSAPPGALQTFHGVRSRLANHDRLAEAQAAYRKAANPNNPEFQEAIWKDTGWWMGPDGEWRFEVPDTGSSFRLSAPTARDKAGNEYLNFPVDILAKKSNPLDWNFRQGFGPHNASAGYPQLGKTNIRGVPALWGNVYGGYSPAFNEIRLAGLSPERAVPTMLHELQHGIQEIEGFLPGSNVQAHLPPKYNEARSATTDATNTLRGRLTPEGRSYLELLNSINQAKPGSKHEMTLLDDLGATPNPPPEEHARINRILDLYQIWRQLNNVQNKAHTKYENTYGEREARNVAKRFQNPELYDIFPPYTMDPIK